METAGQVSHTGTSDYPHYQGHSQGNGCSYLVVNSMGSLVGGKERAVSPPIELFSGTPMSRLGSTQSVLDLCGYAAAAPVSAVVSR